MLKRIIFIFVFLLFLLNHSVSYSGNPEIIHPVTGESIGWEKPSNIPYWVDQGPLGRLTNIQARALMEAMMGVWASVPTADVGFSYQGELAEDVTEENIVDYLAMTSCGGSDRKDIPEDVIPIVFDSDGKILEYLAGFGSSNDIGGLATLRCFVGTTDDPKALYQGMIIINGRFVDGIGPSEGSPEDLSVNGIAGVMLHELGHLLGLDHSSVNEEIFDKVSSGDLSADSSRYLPIMLPTVLRQSISSTTLHPDDVATISVLYPASGYLSSVGDIEGEVVDKDGEELRKVNVIARNIEDPLCEAYAALSGRRCVPLVDAYGEPNFNMSDCTSDDLFGDYAIEGLPPGEYTVEVEELSSGWIRSGMFPATINDDLPGDAEFYNFGDGVEESSYKYTTVEILGGEIISDINIALNGSEADADQLNRIPLDVFDGGSGGRCKKDQLDYEIFINNADAEYAVLPDSSSSSSFEDRVSSSGGGCQLVAGKKGNSFLWILLVPFILIAGRFMLGKRMVILILCILAFSGSVFASSVMPVDLNDMAQKAGKIFFGRCVDVRMGKDERGLAATWVTYDVVRGTKGVDSKTVTFKVFGVAANTGEGKPTTMVGVNHFALGSENVLFLYEESSWGFTLPIGLWQGDFPVINTEEGSRLVKKSDSFRSVINSRLKGNGCGEDPVETPDDLLDRVDKILGR